ncbi:MAG: ribosomal protein S6--L-glutamate ligase [Gammaproteobacteria bacterium]
MNIWLLSHLEGSPGTALILRAATKAGHRIELIHPMDLGFVMGAQGVLAITRHGNRTELPGVVFTRMGASSPVVGLHVLFQLQRLNIPVINDPRCLWLTRDKVRSFQVLAGKSLPVPTTFVPCRTGTPEDVERQLGPPPWIVKHAEGCKGEAVFLVHSHEELTPHLRNEVDPSLVQRFISESSGVDVRVFVVAGKALAAIRRRSPSGDFRSNLHLGGEAEAISIQPEIAEISERAVAALGLDVAGVDILESAQGPLIIEVNGSPGFAGIEDACGVDLCSHVIDLLVSRADETS